MLRNEIGKVLSQDPIVHALQFFANRLAGHERVRNVLSVAACQSYVSHRRLLVRMINATDKAQADLLRLEMGAV
jgi:hypothetical protein